MSILIILGGIVICKLLSDSNLEFIMALSLWFILFKVF